MRGSLRHKFLTRRIAVELGQWAMTAMQDARSKADTVAAGTLNQAWFLDIFGTVCTENAPSSARSKFLKK